MYRIRNRIVVRLAATIVAAGALVLLLVVRKSDVANVNPEAAPVPGV